MIELLICILVLIIVCSTLLSFFGSGIDSPTRALPDELPQLTSDEVKTLELYMKEWQVVIDTQMHFNDLIIRFRTLTLTTFAALVGAAITIGKAAALNPEELVILLGLPIVFWISAWVIDFCYYHQLLLGSVAAAEKFDKSQWLASRGLFGMTECISEHTTPRVSRTLLVIYYAFPLVVCISTLLYWLISQT